MILDDIVCKRREQLAQEMARTPLEADSKGRRKNGRNQHGILLRL